MPAIAVVIPFFQRKPQILARTLASVMAQTDLDGVTVHIVDDGSPVDPEPEMAPFQAMPGGERLRLHRKPNGGAGSARNYALDRLGGADIVAFLDSDDAWVPDHLADVKRAMARSADFYFADYRREGDSLPRFAETGFMPSGPEEGGMVRLTADLFSAVLFGSPIGISTAAYRVAAAPGLRFTEIWRHGGEDTLFWLQLIPQCQAIDVSTREVARYGFGVNTFAGCRWGTRGDLECLRETMWLHSWIPELFALTPEQAQWNSRWLRKLDSSFASSFLAACRHGELGGWREFVAYAAKRPGMIARLLPVAASLALGKRGMASF